MVNVEIDPEIRHFVGDQAELNVEANSIRQLVDEIDRRYPGFRQEVLSREGRIKRYIWFRVEVKPEEELEYDRYEIVEDLDTTLQDHTNVKIDFAMPSPAPPPSESLW
jgi:hypothetical protein